MSGHDQGSLACFLFSATAVPGPVQLVAMARYMMLYYYGASVLATCGQKHGNVMNPTIKHNY